MAKKSYLLIYNEDFGTRDQVTTLMNEVDMIKTWRYDMPNMYYIVSENTAKELSLEFRRRRETGRFIVCEYTENSYGWLSSEAWYILQNKTLKPKET